MSLMSPLLLQAAMLAGQAQAVAATPAPQAAVVQESYTAQLQRARGLAASGDPAQREQAIVLYGQMLQASPGNSDVLLARGRTYAWMRRFPESESDLQAVVAAKPDYVDAWSALGDMYLWSDRPQLAVQAYTHWMELAPADPAAAIARGRANRAAGDMQAARADFAAAGLRGADAGEVTRLDASTMPRFAVPEAMATDGYRWLLRAGVDHTGFNGDRDDWTDYDVSLRRKFARGSLALEWLGADHFNTSDTAWALDGYASLWSRAYANLRYQAGPADGILARSAWRVELFQGIGRGWELSASIDHLRFSSDTEFYGFGVAKYIGNWYLRYKLQHVPGVGSGSWSHRVVARDYYHGDADDYFELSASSGLSSDLDNNGAVVRDSNLAVGVAWMHYVRPQWGFKLGAGYADNADGFDEQRLSFALYRRW